MQMAIDEAILLSRIENKVPNTLRFFTWKPKCLSIGFFQDLHKEVALSKARDKKVDIVRRYTGGGSVFHDKELTYSLAVSENDVGEDIIESYGIICNAIISGLHAIGISSAFKPINDVIVGNKKISGNAQTRKKGIVLQHGTILLDVDVKEMFSLLNVSSEKIKDKMIEAVEDRVTSLHDVLDRNVSLDELQTCLLQGFEDVFDVTFKESDLTPEEEVLAKKLCDEKYATSAWRELR